MEASEGKETVFGLEPAGPLSADEEKELSTFMNKVMAACKDDSSVPASVALQMQEWLKELEEHKDDPVEGGEQLQGDQGGS